MALVFIFYFSINEKRNFSNNIKESFSYQLSDDLNVGLNASYDDAFDTWFSGNFKYNFGGKSKTCNSKIIDAITISPRNRDESVHDISEKEECYASRVVFLHF